MGYKDDYSITKFKTEYENEKLSISLEKKVTELDLEHDRVYLLYIPNKNEFNHYHIELPHESLVKLHGWLEEYLKEHK